MQKLQTVNAETLLYEPLEKPSFVVDSLIPTGLSLFCGSQKIGKSWLMLKLCLCVSQGIPLWDMPTMEGDVLYLCLEDTFCRIQDRLFRLTDEASGRLHFAVASCKLSDGLIVQLEDYLKDYPDSRLIVIDTLQKVRTKATAALIFQSCCGNQRTTSNSSDFAPIWLLGAQIKIKKEPITAVFQTAYYRLCVCASGSFN